MVPLSVKVQAISRAEQRRAGTHDWLDRFQGFAVDGPDGQFARVDVVDRR
jgi:hypothetical protein